MQAKKLRDYLDDNEVKYFTITHSPAFTMSEIAAAAHIGGKRVAKAVMVKVDGEMAMAVVPSNLKVDFDHLKHTTGAESIELATEEEFINLFPGCELGAMPPFGNLYGLDVYVSPELAKEDEIVFNACSHTELMRVAYADFARLAQPRVPAESFGA